MATEVEAKVQSLKEEYEALLTQIRIKFNSLIMKDNIWRVKYNREYTDFLDYEITDDDSTFSVCIKDDIIEVRADRPCIKIISQPYKDSKLFERFSHLVTKIQNDKVIKHWEDKIYALSDSLQRMK